MASCSFERIMSLDDIGNSLREHKVGPLLKAICDNALHA